jgi:aryl-alcohol dehydrogenase-like predicted oxidoreductase
MLDRDYEWELMQMGLEEGLGAVIWSPLGWGRLSGKIRRGQPAPKGSRMDNIQDRWPNKDEILFAIVDVMDEIAKETGKTIPQIALNWLLRRPSVSSVIIGARNEEQLKDNLGADGWALSPEQVARLDKASAQYPSYPFWHQRRFPELTPMPGEG